MSILTLDQLADEIWEKKMEEQINELADRLDERNRKIDRWFNSLMKALDKISAKIPEKGHIPTLDENSDARDISEIATPPVEDSFKIYEKPAFDDPFESQVTDEKCDGLVFDEMPKLISLDLIRSHGEAYASDESLVFNDLKESEMEKSFDEVVDVAMVFVKTPKSYSFQNCLNILEAQCTSEFDGLTSKNKELYDTLSHTFEQGFDVLDTTWSPAPNTDYFYAFRIYWMGNYLGKIGKLFMYIFDPGGDDNRLISILHHNEVSLFFIHQSLLSLICLLTTEILIDYISESHLQACKFYSLNTSRNLGWVMKWGRFDVITEIVGSGYCGLDDHFVEVRSGYNVIKPNVWQIKGAIALFNVVLFLFDKRGNVHALINWKEGTHHSFDLCRLLNSHEVSTIVVNAAGCIFYSLDGRYLNVEFVLLKKNEGEMVCQSSNGSLIIMDNDHTATIFIEFPWIIPLPNATYEEMFDSLLGALSFDIIWVEIGYVTSSSTTSQGHLIIFILYPTYVSHVTWLDVYLETAIHTVEENTIVNIGKLKSFFNVMFSVMDGVALAMTRVTIFDLVVMLPGCQHTIYILAVKQNSVNLRLYVVGNTELEVFCHFKQMVIRECMICDFYMRDFVYQLWRKNGVHKGVAEQVLRHNIMHVCFVSRICYTIITIKMVQYTILWTLLLLYFKTGRYMPLYRRETASLALLYIMKMRRLECHGGTLPSTIIGGLMELYHSGETLTCHNLWGTLRHVFDILEYLQIDCYHWSLTHFHMDHYHGFTRSLCNGKIYCFFLFVKTVIMKFGISRDKLQFMFYNEKINIARVDVIGFEAISFACEILYEPLDEKNVLHTWDYHFSDEAQMFTPQPCYTHRMILDTNCFLQYDFQKQNAVVQLIIMATQAEEFNPHTPSPFSDICFQPQVVIPSVHALTPSFVGCDESWVDCMASVISCLGSAPGNKEDKGLQGGFAASKRSFDNEPSIEVAGGATASFVTRLESFVWDPGLHFQATALSHH